MIGNSSSGIIEMPSFTPKHQIDLGIRQLGRIKAKSTINVDFNEQKITSAINKVLSKKFKKSLLKVVNPYEKKNSSDRIITILRRTNFRKLQSKNFFDYKII